MNILDTVIGNCLTRYEREDYLQVLCDLKQKGGRILVVSQFCNVPLDSDMTGAVDKSNVDGYFLQVCSANDTKLNSRSGKYYLMITDETDTQYHLEFLAATIDSSD